MKVFVVVLTALVLVSADDDRLIWNIYSDGLESLRKPHIAGGQEVQPHSFPHQVALVSKKLLNGEQTMCGGSLITPQWILTAAHCTVNITDTFALLGAHNIRMQEKSQQKIKVAETLTDDHWNYKSALNDIALMKLEKPAVLNEYVQTIRLPSSSQGGITHENELVTIIGWGKYSDVINKLSPVLKSIESKVISNIDCTYRHGLGRIRWNHLCAASPARGGVCPGDSGGPMLWTEDDGQRTVLGIASFRSPKGCDNSIPTVFTRIDRYLSWISTTTGLKGRS